jgi:hypothetical protein
MAPGAHPGLSYPLAVIRAEPRGSSSKVLQNFEKSFMLTTDLKGLYNFHAPQKVMQLAACPYWEVSCPQEVYGQYSKGMHMLHTKRKLHSSVFLQFLASHFPHL